MSAFDTILARARKHRRTGPHSAVISCPAAGHEDRNPSVTVTEKADGTILMCCWSRGCDFAAMASGLGMDLQEFFPPRLNVEGHYRPSQRIEAPARDILAALADEILLSYVVINDFHDFILSQGEKGSWPDGTTTERMTKALARIRSGAEEASGKSITDELLVKLREAARLTVEEERDIDYLRDHGVTMKRKAAA